MKRAGFNMIELVFVVAMVGILTAIAVPKFAIGREDACYAKLRADLAEAQSTLSREYTKYFLQGKNITASDLKDILGLLESGASNNCYFSVGTISVNNGTVNGTLTAYINSKTVSMELKNQSDTTTSSTTGLTKQPVITCDLSNEICQKITGKVKQ